MLEIQPADSYTRMRWRKKETRVDFAKHAEWRKGKQIHNVERFLGDMASGLLVMLGGKRHDRSNYTDIAHPHLVLLVLPSVGEAGDDGRDPGGRGDLAGIDHDQELHQIVIYLPAATLHDVDVLPTNTLPYLHAARGARR